MPFTEKPVQQGTHLKTQMIRVDSDFAAAVKREATKFGIKVTEVTRHLYEALYGNHAALVMKDNKKVVPRKK